nr:unnamed protein product [Callosobruchus chinensis]
MNVGRDDPNTPGTSEPATTSSALDPVNYIEEEDTCATVPQKITVSKKSWSDAEIHLLKEHFSREMNENKYPSSEMIRAFIKEINIKRTGPQINRNCNT